MATPKKPAKKVAVSKKTVTKASPKKTIPIKKPSAKSTLTVHSPFTKSQIVTYLSDATEIKKKDVVALFEAIIQLMKGHLGKNGPKEFNFAGLFKCRVIHKPATKSRNGTNPFTGQPTVFPAKAARNVLKIRPLKKLKEVVG